MKTKLKFLFFRPLSTYSRRFYPRPLALYLEIIRRDGHSAHYGYPYRQAVLILRLGNRGYHTGFHWYLAPRISC